MKKQKKITTALISVFNKDNLGPIVNRLNDLGVTIYSTGGTGDFITSLNIPFNKIEDLTLYPSILGGRVKTLHPKVFGGILCREDHNSDKTDLLEYNIPKIDLVIVDLYPFEETVNAHKSNDAIIEKIDIGGVSLIRAGAKNFKNVLVISERVQYAALLEILNKNKTTLEERKLFAEKAFDISSHYDTAIFNYFKTNEQTLKQSIREYKLLRYGENPHQKGVFFGDLDKLFDQLNGKELSYNNLLDIDASLNIISEFNDTTFIIIKHNNACGIASRDNLLDAWKAALQADPISAFGGVLITNAEINSETAQEINNLFFEIIISPSYNKNALNLLRKKKNRIILLHKKKSLIKTETRAIMNGILYQEKDLKTDSIEDIKIVTKNKPTEQQLADLIFASKVCKHSKSNAIVFAKNKQMLSSGIGQTSRVDALNQAVQKAKVFGLDLNGAVMASDAFFPFPDCVELANKAGIKTVIQPGGSIKDNLSIEYCNRNKICMAMTGTRHFKH